MGTVLLIAGLAVLSAFAFAVQQRAQARLAKQLAELAQRFSAASGRLEAAEVALALITTRVNFRTPEPPNPSQVRAAQHRALWGYDS